MLVAHTPLVAWRMADSAAVQGGADNGGGGETAIMQLVQSLEGCLGDAQNMYKKLTGE